MRVYQPYANRKIKLIEYFNEGTILLCGIAAAPLAHNYASSVFTKLNAGYFIIAFIMLNAAFNLLVILCSMLNRLKGKNKKVRHN